MNITGSAELPIFKHWMPGEWFTPLKDFITMVRNILFIVIFQAKLKASLKWMVAKAYKKYDPPPDLKDPFFRDAEVSQAL